MGTVSIFPRFPIEFPMIFLINGKPVGARNWVKPDQFLFSRSLWVRPTFTTASRYWCVMMFVCEQQDTSMKRFRFIRLCFFLRVAILCALSEFDIYVIRFCQLKSTSCQNKKYQSHSNSFQSIYIYIHHYTNYTPIVQILLEKKYTRLHPLTLWLPRSWVPLVASSTISWWRRWVCREHMRVSPPKKWVSMHEKISKTPIPIISTFFLPKILQLCPDLSPLRPSPLCEASVGIRKHQCHGSRPKTIHSFPPIRDMEKPNTSAWHIFWYMFIYIYIYYIILYYIILYYIILYYIILYYVILYYIILYYIYMQCLAYVL